MPEEHRKPTKEELEAGIAEVIEEEQEEVTPDDSIPEEDPNPPADGEGEDDTLNSEEEEETGDEGVGEEEEYQPTAKQEEKPPVDFEKRYKDSSREAHIIRESKEKQDQEIDAAQNISAPSEDEIREDLQKDNVEYDDLSNFEKRLARENLHQRNINNRIKEIREKYRADEQKIQERAQEVEVFAIDPDILKKFPKLEGKQDAFVSYATKPSRIVMDLEDLAKLFILDLPEPKKNKGRQMEAGSGGPNGKPKVKTGIITDPDIAEKLRQTDFKKYTQLLRAKRIQIDVE